MWGGERLIHTIVGVWQAQSFTSLLMQSARVDGKMGISMNSSRDKRTSGDSSIDSKDPSNASSHSNTGDTLSSSCVSEQI